MAISHHFCISHSVTLLASSAEFPQNNTSGLKPEHTAGRDGSPNIAHFKSSVSCTHLTPAGFPNDIPGIAELIDGYIQHAPQPGRHSMEGLGFERFEGFEEFEEFEEFQCFKVSTLRLRSV